MTEISRVFADPKSILVKGYHAPANKEHPHQNDPVLSVPTGVPADRYFQANYSGDFRDQISRSIKYITEESHFKGAIPRDLERLLNDNVYVIDGSPRIMDVRSPDTVAYLIDRLHGNKKLFCDLTQRMAQIFLGSSYTRNWAYFAGAGEGNFNAQNLHKNLPRLYSALRDHRYIAAVNEDNLPVAAGQERDQQQPYIPVDCESHVEMVFAQSIAPEDLPGIISVMNDAEGSGYFSYFLGDNRDEFTKDFDGIAYSKIVHFRNRQTSVLPFLEIGREYAKNNARFLGTIGTCLTEGWLVWPEAQVQPLAKRLSGIFTDLVFSSAETRARDRDIAHQVQVLRDAHQPNPTRRAEQVPRLIT